MRKTPLYQIVKDSLRAQIDTGELMTGARIDSEEVLADAFGCSRLTVHRALRELADEGLLVRNRRAGTQVAERDTGGVLIRVPRIREEVEALGLAYRYELLARRHAAPSRLVAGLLRVGVGRRMLQVVSRHWASERVFQHENRWINVDEADGALDVDFSEVSANDWLLKNAAYSCIDHEISALCADAETADDLRVAEGAALLQVRRLTHLAKKRVTYAVLMHPGDLLTLRSETRAYSLNAS